jgi:hypothetical protein
MAHDRDVHHAACFLQRGFRNRHNGVGIEAGLLGCDSAQHELMAVQVLEIGVADVVPRIVRAVRSGMHAVHHHLRVGPRHPGKVLLQRVRICRQLIDYRETLMPDSNPHRWISPSAEPRMRFSRFARLNP